MRKAILFIISSFVFFIVLTGSSVSAAVTITTPATGDISSDSSSGSSVSVPNIVITEGAIEEIAVGTHVWTVPSGYIFDTASAPDVTYTNGLAGDATATMTSTTLTIAVTSTSTPAGVMTIGSVTPIKVKATTACPMASAGNLTHSSGTIAGITNDVTSFGTWTQVPGAISYLVVKLPEQTALSSSTCAVPGGTPSDVFTNFDVTVYAMDQAYNLGAPNDYSDGTKTLTYTPTGESATNVSVTFSGGVASNIGVTADASTESKTITFTDGGSYGLASAAFNVGAPARATDSTPPTSSIIFPVDGQKIDTGKSHTITGTSADTGGSSVQKVEVSFDGGLSWEKVTPTSLTSNNGFNWKYEWVNPKEGSYSIKTRGVDWVNNLEVLHDGVTVTVESPEKELIIKKSTKKATENKPISQKSKNTISKKSKDSSSLVKIKGSPKVYVLSNNKKRHIPNPEVFNSYNYSWDDIKIISPEVLNSYEEVSLVRRFGDDKVYLINGNKKTWIKTAEEFEAAGYNWSDIVEINSTELEAY